MKLDWKAVLGIVVTVFLLWWVFREVDFSQMWTRVREGDLGLLAAAIGVTTAGFLVRAMRWKVLLHPLRPDIPLRSRFAAVSVGFMANNVLPARAGEFARAYALSRAEPVSASGAFGTLVVERALDGVTLLVFLLLAIASPAFPESTVMGGGTLRGAVIGFSGFVAVLVLGMLLLLIVPRPFVRIVKAVATRLPAAVERLIVDAMEAFLDALDVLRRPRLLLLAIAWTVGFWLFNGFSFWLGMRAFGIDLGMVAALFTQSVVGFAVALPSVPGFFGPFQLAVDLALHGAYGVDKDQAMAFAVGYNVGAWFPITGIGLWYAWKMGLSMGEVGRSEEKVEAAVEAEHPEVAAEREGRA